MKSEKWVARALLLAGGAFGLVLPAYASQHHAKPSVHSSSKPVMYETDGTPIATGAPRRLSSLAMGGSAWASYHEARGKKHRQQIANKQRPPIR